jgi:hypothetical protein
MGRALSTHEIQETAYKLSVNLKEEEKHLEELEVKTRQ